MRTAQALDVLLGDHTDGSMVDWLQKDFSLADVRWLRFDINAVATKGNIVDKPDLSKVDEIGFVDLMPGSGHGPGGWTAKTMSMPAIAPGGRPRSCEGPDLRREVDVAPLQGYTICNRGSHCDSPT